MESKVLRLVTAIAFIFLGIMLLLHPDSVTTMLVIALGVAALGYAVINGLQFIRTRTPLSGIIAVALGIVGVILVLQPALKLTIYDKLFGVCLAVILILAGVLVIKEALVKDNTSKLVGAVVGGVIVLIGITTLFKPSLGFLSLLMGLACLAMGAMQLYEIISGNA